MINNFLDICYELLSHYLNFPDVADTYKSIKTGLYYRDSFPQNADTFEKEKGAIISYIEKVRVNNVIDAYRKKENLFLLVPVPTGRPLADATPEELYNNLIAEIPRLIFKGIHQLIKNMNAVEDDNQLTSELLQQDSAVLRKYRLL